jgi:hypothetical protein
MAHVTHLSASVYQVRARIHQNTSMVGNFGSAVKQSHR